MNGSDTLAKLAMAKMARVDPVPYNLRTGEEYGIVRVEIDSITHNQVIPRGLVERGKHVYEIYSNHLSEVEALVETASEEELSRVGDDFALHKAECGGKDGEKPINRRAYMPSLAASFRTIMHRDMLPFRSLEVLPAPKARTAKG